MSSGERVPLEAALVRVWRGSSLVGAGFLAGPAHVLTAAHVVTDALGPAPAREGSREDADPGEALPVGSTVTLDFPLLAPGLHRAAEVVAWHSPVPGRGTDVAGLRLLDPAPDGARPLVLRRRRGGLNGLLVMVGFPRGLELGTWVYGREGGPVATGWVEIESDPTRQAVLSPGFSGTPVWSPDADAVVGMVGYKVSGAGPKIGYMMPVDTLLAAWPELTGVIEQRSPFRALRAFTEQDAELFYGRDELATQIADRIGDGVPVISVIGGSGAGKSSLWHAGVVPRLRTRRERPVVVTLRPSDAGTPLNALAFALDTLLEPDRDASARLASVEGLASRLARGAMADVVAAVLERHRGGRLLICVDQFEEVFGRPAADRAAFTGALGACLTEGSRLSVLVNLRDTFLGAVLSDRPAAELARRWLPVTVGEMTRAELRQVMTGPLRRLGTVEFADGLVERILEDLKRTPNPLPLLEFTLAELWERRSAGLLTHEAYEEVGGVSRALAGYADRVWAGLDPGTRATAERLLVQLARPLHRDELTVRSTALREECDDAQWAVAQRLATTRLLVLHEVNAGLAGQEPVPGVELAHDSLLTQWELLRLLTERFRAFRVWQDGLRQRIDIWSHHKSPGRLLSGADLRDARRWAATHGEHLSAREHAFIKAGRRRRRLLGSGIAAVLAVALVVATAVYQHRSAQVAEVIARDLAVKARQLDQADSFGAVQLGMRAYRTDSSVGLDAAKPGAYAVADKLLPHHDVARDLDTAGPSRSGAPPAGPSGTPAPTSGTPAPTSSSAAAALETSARVENEDLTQMASADGRTLVTTDASSRIALWRLSGQGVAQESLSSLFGPNDYAGSPVISRSGRYVVFRQMVGIDFGDMDVDDPADDNGLPRIDPDDYATCVPESLLSVTSCLVVYDTVEHEVASAREIERIPVIGNVRMSVDPTDRVLGMVVSDALLPTLQSGLHNTLYLFDLRTGRLLRQTKLPWPSMVTELWLGPGGTTATVSEVLADDLKARADLSLSWVDLGRGAVTRRRLVADPTTLNAVTMSLDGGTVAALVREPGTGTRGLVAWSTATGEVVSRIPRLVESGDFGTLALDATGTTAWVSTLAQEYGPLTGRTASATGMQVEPIIGATLAQRVSVRSLPNGGETGRFDYSGGWIWPLGSGTGAPLALVDGSTLGIVLDRPGEPDPLRRLAAAKADPGSGRKLTLSGLCALLGEPNHDKATRDLVPPGAYQGALCP
ncbi:S1 family peptidase [Streptomyces maremycinicus]|uniref:S1 family peptidase n=1 Tax=Streptomyces maremycinicus TaxID=1679753 RepID=UPI00078688A3|nr:serine protease [Streptomyces sp. NBRC 110468]